MRKIKLNLKKPQITKPSKRSLLFIGGLSALILVIIGAIYLNSDKFEKNSDPVIFSIEGKKYRDSEVSELIKYPVEVGGIDKNEAAKQAFDLLKKVSAAEQLGIKFSEEEISEYQKDKVRNTQDQDLKTKYENWFLLIAKEGLIENYVGVTLPPGYKGYSFDFYFGQHLQFGPAYKPAGFNDPKLIEQDKSYAKEKADYYHKQLKDGNMKPDEALNQILTDPRLGNDVKSSSNHSTRFGEKPNLNWQTQIFYKPVTSFITSQKKPALSDVQTGKALVGIDTQAEPVDMYYYFVLVEEVPKNEPVSMEEFDKRVHNLKTEYKGY